MLLFHREEPAERDEIDDNGVRDAGEMGGGVAAKRAKSAATPEATDNRTWILSWWDLSLRLRSGRRQSCANCTGREDIEWSTVSVGSQASRHLCLAQALRDTVPPIDWQRAGGSVIELF